MIEPSQLETEIYVGPHCRYDLVDEWVCNHCGQYGEGKDPSGIEHEAECGYEAGRMALEITGT